VRSGPWKLMVPQKFRSMKGQAPGKDGTPGKYAPQPLPRQLFHLETDLGETTDVSEKHPEIVAKLELLLSRIRADLGDAITKTPARGARPAGK
jgi:arylsulfatase A